jgi:predicted aspartyl protease
MCPDHLARYVSPAIVAALLALVPMRPAPAAPWRAQPPAAADEGEQATARPVAEAHRLPADYSAGVFFVRASINGTGSLWFTIDTGATLTVIDPGTAKRLGLPVRDTGMQSDVGTASGTTPVGVTRPVAILVGDLAPFLPQRLYVVPVSSNAGLFRHQVDGVLGTDFLSRYVMEFDYGAGTVTAHDPDTFSCKGQGARIPASLDGNLLLVPATLTLPDETQLGARLLVDTGSNARLTLNSPFVRRNRLVERFPSRSMTASYGINGLITAPLIRLRSLALGTATIVRPNTGLSQAASGLHASAGFDGIIGAELLKSYRVIVDYRRREVILEPLPPASTGGSGSGTAESGCEPGYFCLASSSSSFLTCSASGPVGEI